MFGIAESNQDASKEGLSVSKARAIGSTNADSQRGRKIMGLLAVFALSQDHYVRISKAILLESHMAKASSAYVSARPRCDEDAPRQCPGDETEKIIERSNCGPACCQFRGSDYYVCGQRADGSGHWEDGSDTPVCPDNQTGWRPPRIDQKREVLENPALLHNKVVENTDAATIVEWIAQTS